MKRSLALLLTSLLLVFSLAACGKDQQPGGVDGSGAVTGGDNTGSLAGNGGDNAGGLTGNNGANGDAANGSVTGGVNNNGGGPMVDGAMDTMDDAGNAVRNTVQRAGDALTGDISGYTNNRTSGYTYDQMVENGRVF